MASLTVRNLPDDAKHRFRQVAAAHGRSMEEHLRQLVIDAGSESGRASASQVAEAPQAFEHFSLRERWVRELVKIADNGASESPSEENNPRHAEIRYMTAKDAMVALRQLANGVGLDLPPRMNTSLEAPSF